MRRAFPHSDNPRRAWQITQTIIADPDIGRAVPLDQAPNAFILWRGGRGDGAAEEVYRLLQKESSRIPSFRFYEAASVGEILDYMEQFGIVPVILRGVEHRKSFTPFARTRLRHSNFKHCGLPNTVDWMIEVSVHSPKKCVSQCVTSLVAWFENTRFKESLQRRKPGEIHVPWGTLLKQDTLIGCDSETLKPKAA